MAEYPSIPQYGGLNFSQWPASTTPQPQPPPHQQTTTSSFPSYPHQQSTNYLPTPSSSTAFEANSRIPGLGGFHAPPPPPLPTEVLTPFANSPVPQVPIPQSELRSIPGLGTDSAFSARRTSVEAVYLPSEPAPNVPDVNVGAVPEVTTSREEGELSDGELEEGMSESEDSPYSDKDMGNVTTKPITEPSLSEDDGSISSYNPPSASSVEAVELVQSADLPTQQSATNSTPSVLDLKTKAKGAILSLSSHNINFHDLVNEGIDEAVLRLLYEEIGIQDTVMRGKEIERPDLPKPAPDPSITVSSQAKVASSIEGSREPTSFRVAPTSVQVPRGGKSSSVTANHVSQSVTPGETSGATNAALERKDRIAQLLALKAAKTAKSQSPSNVPAENDQSVVKPASSASNGPTQLKPSSAASVPETASGTEDQTVKKKNKAQTDLVRAKMETLKQQALAKAQAQKATLPMPGVEKTLTTSTQAPSSVPSNVPVIALTGSGANIGTNGTPTSQKPSLTASSVRDSPTNKTSHKRPLASDLFEEATPPTRRPFGRKESCDNVEIVVSDEEGEVSDADMDLDEDSDLSQGEIRDHSKVTGSDRASTPRHSETRATTEGRETALPLASNASAAPSASVTPSKEKEQDELWRAKNEEIALMRKRIAEMEYRRRTKQDMINLGQSPGPGTPAPADIIPAGSSSVATPTKQSSIVESGSGNESSPRQNDSIVKQSSNASGIIPSTNAAARAEALRKRLVRRREIHAGLPLIDAEVERTRSRLAEIQKEAERLQAEIQKGLEARQNLLRELELLGVDTDAAAVEKMRLPELKAVRDELVEAQQQQHSTEALNDANAGSGHVPSDVKKPATDIPASTTETPDQSDSEDSAMDESSISPDHEPGSIASAADVQVTPTPAAAEDTMVFSPDGGAALSTAMNGVASNDTSAVNVTMPDHTENGSGDDSGSVSMSDSASESSQAYEPVDDTMDTTHVEGQGVSTGDENTDDGYEPTDATPATDAVNAISEDGPTSNVPDLENSHELTESNIMVKPQEVGESVGLMSNAEPQKPRFVPYDSVLKTFKNYRFNPQFTSEVAGGYRSLTYSSKIDARRVLCSTEAKGEVCKDPTCEDQHFAQMGLPDDKILVEMSSAPGLDKESRNRFVNGLKSVIADLRSRGVKEFEQVAQELAAYRRRFEAEQDPLLAPPTTSSAIPTNTPLTSQ